MNIKEYEEEIKKEWKEEINNCSKIHSHAEDDEEGYINCLCCNAIERINIKFETKLKAVQKCKELFKEMIKNTWNKRKMTTDKIIFMIKFKEELLSQLNGEEEMKKHNIYYNSQDMLMDLKSGKIKKGQPIILDEQALTRDSFILSRGNKKVLETILSMMENLIYRDKLRALVMDFLFEKEKNNDN